MPQPTVISKQLHVAGTNRPAVAAAASITLPAVAGSKYLCRSITVSLAAGVTPSGICQVVLRDSTTGAGNILWQADLQNVANGVDRITLSDLNIPGVVGQAMTLEFVAAPAATNQAAVSIEAALIPRDPQIT